MDSAQESTNDLTNCQDLEHGDYRAAVSMLGMPLGFGEASVESEHLPWGHIFGFFGSSSIFWVPQNRWFYFEDLGVCKEIPVYHIPVYLMILGSVKKSEL